MFHCIEQQISDLLRILEVGGVLGGASHPKERKSSELRNRIKHLDTFFLSGKHNYKVARKMKDRLNSIMFSSDTLWYLYQIRTKLLFVSYNITIVK